MGVENPLRETEVTPSGPIPPLVEPSPAPAEPVREPAEVPA